MNQTGVDFLTPAERSTCEAFLRDGFVIAPAADAAALARIRAYIATRTATYLGLPEPDDAGAFLDAVGDHVAPAQLNGLRLNVIDGLLAQAWLRSAYFACARGLLETLVGNELAMQRGFGLSIQLPGDSSSVLPLHSDVWSEDSPFEAVLWIPLVDCFATKSMFLLPPEPDMRWRTRLHEFASAGVDALFEAVEPDLRWLDVAFGQVLVFSHTLMHGNRINAETTTRWSLNVRFKSLFTPYSDKSLGDFSEPITIRPLTRIGMTYELPAASMSNGGYRGYIASRPVRGSRTPQRVQNLVVRDYAQRHGLAFKLSLAEYAMPGCYIMLRTLLAELERLDGAIVFSMFMLPAKRVDRQFVYARVLQTATTLHAALEGVALRTAADIARFEDTLLVARALARAPLRGRYDKSSQAAGRADAFARACAVSAPAELQRDRGEVR